MAMSRLVPLLEFDQGYATATTVAKYGKVPAIAAFDSGNLLAVARALRERWPDKGIVIAGDDDHKLENNPGRAKALEGAQAVGGMAVFPNSSLEQREKGMTDFNDLSLENAALVAAQFQEVLKRMKEQGRGNEFGREMEKGIMHGRMGRPYRKTVSDSGGNGKASADKDGRRLYDARRPVEEKGRGSIRPKYAVERGREQSIGIGRRCQEN
jgi:hypothetical protein